MNLASIFSFKNTVAAAGAIVALTGAWVGLSVLEIRPAFLNEVYAGDKKVKSIHIVDIKQIGGDLYANMIRQKRYELLDLRQYRNRKLREFDNDGCDSSTIPCDPSASVHPSIEKDIIGMEEQLKQLQQKRSELKGRK